MQGFTFKRNYTAEELVSKNPVLKDGLTVIDPTTQGLKIGDGVTRWADLSYVSSGSDDNGTSPSTVLYEGGDLVTADGTPVPSAGALTAQEQVTVSNSLVVVYYTGSAWPARPAVTRPVLFDSSAHVAAPDPFVVGVAINGDRWWERTA